MENDDNDMPALVSSSDEEEFDSDDQEDNDDLWEDCDEEMMNILVGEVTCLFCPSVEQSVDDIITHCKAEHHFDIPLNCQRWSVDCIQYIKMINFCRKENPSPDQLLQGLMSGGAEWQADEFMQASNPSDLLLLWDIEAVVESLPVVNAKQKSPTNKDKSNNFTDSDCGYQDVQSSEAIVALTARVKAAEDERNLLREDLDRVLQDMEKLKVSGQQLVMNMAGDVKDVKKVKKKDALSDEDGYFASYSHHGIHMTMLKDEVRTKSYRDFMLCNRNLFEGKTVLDVGCGTGILSLFAVQAGAKQVVTVDSSQIIYQAMDIARENNMHEKITFVKGRLEDVTLPVDKFDVIISEWMGYFLLFEAMLDSIVWARDRYLAPGGCVYPDHFTMKIVGVADAQLHQQTVGFWDDVYGFKMSCMKRPVLEEVQVCTVSGENVVTEPAVIKEINVPTCKVSELDFESDFNLVCQMDAELTAIVGYFDTYFIQDTQQRIHFSTGPKSVKTHWEQAVMILPKPMPVKKGCSLPCHISYKKLPHDSRGVLINLMVGQTKLKYVLS